MLKEILVLIIAVIIIMIFVLNILIQRSYKKDLPDADGRCFSNINRIFMQNFTVFLFIVALSICYILARL